MNGTETNGTDSHHRSATCSLPGGVDGAFLRMLGLMNGLIGVNTFGMTFLDEGTSSAALSAVGVAGGVLGLLSAFVLFLAVRLSRVRLEGTTLVTRHGFGTRRADLADGRVQVTNHSLVASDAASGRTLRLPLVAAGGPLPPDDLRALADAVEAGPSQHADERWSAAGALRELAADDALRGSLSGRGGIRKAFLVVAGIASAVMALLILVRLLDFAI